MQPIELLVTVKVVYDTSALEALAEPARLFDIVRGSVSWVIKSEPGNYLQYAGPNNRDGAWHRKRTARRFTSKAEAEENTKHWPHAGCKVVRLVTKGRA